MEVLVVDDDPDVRTAFSRALTRAGFEVSGADNGLSALDTLALENRSYRVILCDLQMPKLDGIGLYRQLRRDLPHWADRVLFVTASARDEALFLREAGRPYLVKPVDISELISTVRQLSGPRSDRRVGEERRQSERRQRGMVILVSRRETSDRRGTERRTPPGGMAR